MIDRRQALAGIAALTGALTARPVRAQTLDINIDAEAWHGRQIEPTAVAHHPHRRDLAAALKSCTAPVLVDCLTLWLSNLLLAAADIDAEVAQLEDALAALKAPIVLVTNEVGSGIVPDHPLGRRFRDLQGLVNQRMAARADRVVLVVAGMPLALKGAL